MLKGFLFVGEKSAAVSKQQLSDEFLDGFLACEEAPKVEETAVCSKTDVDVVWQDLFCLMEHDAEEDGEQSVGQNGSLLDTVGRWESYPTETHCASPDLDDLHGAGGGW